MRQRLWHIARREKKRNVPDGRLRVLILADNMSIGRPIASILDRVIITLAKSSIEVLWVGMLQAQGNDVACHFC